MPETRQLDPKRWTALIFIAIAQLMVVLDATIVNIALPSAQADLGFSDSNRQWVVTAYTLAFGGLLLFGGRVSDLWGRKNTFIVGLLGFAMRMLKVPIVPCLLGLILGPTLEYQLRRSLMANLGDPTVFLTRPISLTLLLLAVAFLVLPVLLRARRRPLAPVAP